MATDTVLYPLLKFRFKVKWDGLQNEGVIGFTEVTGLDYSVDIAEYRDGEDKGLTKHKIPGLRKFSNVTLKRGYFQGSRDYWDWIDGTGGQSPDKALLKRKDYRKTVTITMMNDAGEEMFSWNLERALPIKVQFSDLKSDGNEVAIETLELAHEGLTITYL